jgi:putative ABC transport system substrate-binding protein
MGTKLKWTLIVAGMTVIFGLPACQQEQTPVDSRPVVAIYNLLSHPILDASVKGIKQGLADHGYGPHQVRLIEVNANGEMDKLNTFALELLAAKPDVIVPVSTPVTQAVAKVAALSQAIVYSTVTNPDDVGMQDHPANMTGVSDAVNYAANLDLIQAVLSDARSLGIIYNSGERNSQFGVEQTRKLAEKRNLELVVISIAGSGEVADAARSMVGSVDAFYVGSDNTVVSAIDALVSVAYENDIPVFASDAGSVEQGATAAVSVDYEWVGKAAGELVARVLDTGDLPGRLDPVVVRGDLLVVNSVAIERLGLSVPPKMMSEAVTVQ